MFLVGQSFEMTTQRPEDSPGLKRIDFYDLFALNELVFVTSAVAKLRVDSLVGSSVGVALSLFGLNDLS
jgi:hypothetical protein